MVNTNSSFPQEELKSFKDISFKLGSNSHLVQAAGGNTSCLLYTSDAADD